MRQDAAVERSVARAGSAGIVAVVAYFVAPLDRDVGVVLAAGILVALLVLLVPLTVRHARRIEASATPLRDALLALSTLLALLIFGFATVHYTLANNFEDQFDGVETKIDGLYYTMTVISTVGFGDITAVGQVARAVVTLQMLFDLLFLGLAVRLIGQVASQRRGEFRPGKP
jgi:hypothetical protein